MKRLLALLLLPLPALAVSAPQDVLTARSRARTDACTQAADQPEYAHRADRLRDAQRAWIAFRDAQSALDDSLRGNGSMRVLGGAYCQARRTVDRVRDLIVPRDR